MGIGRRLILIVTTINIAILVIVAGVALNSNFGALQAQAKARFAEKNSQVADALDAHLNNVIDATENIIASIGQQGNLFTSSFRQSIREAIVSDTDHLIQRVSVIRPAEDGSSFTSAVSFPIADTQTGRLGEILTISEAENLPSHDKIWQVIETQEPTWFTQDLAYNDPIGEGAVSLAMPYGINGESMVGVLWVDIPLSTFDSLVTEEVGNLGLLTETMDGYALVLDSQGTVVSAQGSLAEEIQANASAYVETIQKQMTGDVLASDFFNITNPVDDSASVVTRDDITTTQWQILTLFPQSDLPQLASDILVQLFVIGAIGIAVLVWAVHRFSNEAIVRPLLTVSRAAHHIGGGDLRYHVGYQGRNDEIGWLARALDDMKQNLAYSYDELQRWSQTLEQRVGRRTEELQYAREQSEFVARELRAVYDESLLVVNEPLLQPILKALTNRILSLLDATYCSVWLLNSKRSQLQLVANTIPGFSEKNITVNINQGMAGQAVQYGRPVVVEDYANYPHRISLPGEDKPPYDRAICVPMVFAGESIGAVLAGRDEEDAPFSEENERLLTLFANMVTPAVRNAQLLVQRDNAVAEAERANQVKTRFLASVTHELRTPLNLIINNMDFMRIGAFGDITPEQEMRLNQTVRSAEHLLYLINDLLDVSKIEAGEMDLFIQPNDIYPMVEDTIDSAYALLDRLSDEAPAIQIITEIEDNLPRIPIDVRRIRQVLTNLMSNAIKFTLEGTIKLSVRRDHDRVIFAVSDTGMGIPEDEMPKLFEAFVRTSNAKQHNIEGTGLGLPISQFLVQQHGGEIQVESVEGEGTTFWFGLPITPRTTPDSKPKVDTQILAVLGADTSLN